VFAEIRHGAHDRVGVTVTQSLDQSKGEDERTARTEAALCYEGQRPDVTNLHNESRLEASAQQKAVNDCKK
jgi:hypothetical protein